MSRILITSALPYVNANQHLGHIVGCHLPADIFARYKRMQGHNVAYVGGSDTHGTPIEVTARKEGVSPQKLIDKYLPDHQKLNDWFGISYDIHSHTNTPEHKEITYEFFKLIDENGYILEKETIMPYCSHDEMFLPDRYIEGKCPKCGEIAKGDQCDCGYVLKNPQELIDPYCVICKNKPEFKATKHLYIDFEKLQPKLDKWVKTKKGEWDTLTYSIAKSWLDKGLKPRAITRDLKWGFSVPKEGYENKVFYVWFDAPIGYVTFSKELKGFESAWEDDNTQIYHFLGKDNIPFHTIFWPGFLAGTKKYRLPDRVIGLAYLNFEGKKFSKSKSIGIFGEDAIKSGIEPDYWRFYLSYLIPENSDTNWEWVDFNEKINKVLVGKISNFAYRTLSLIKREGSLMPKGEDKEFEDKLQKIEDEYHKLMEDIKFREALRKALELVEEGNTYLQEKAPWANEDKSALRVCANLSVRIAKTLAPFIPNFSKEVLEQLNVSDYVELPEGHKIGVPKIIFKKVDVKELMERF